MEPKDTRSACPDCGGSMEPIRLVDQAAGGAHMAMEYAAPDARRHWFSSRFPVAGHVTARICSDCGRIVLHGEPPKEVAPAAPPEGSGAEVSAPE